MTAREERTGWEKRVPGVFWSVAGMAVDATGKGFTQLFVAVPAK